MPDLSLQRKTAILVDGLPSAPDAPQGVRSFTGHRIPVRAIQATRFPGVAVDGAPQAPEKRSSARDELE